MEINCSGSDDMPAPPSYDAMYRICKAYMRSICRQEGIDEGRLDDVVHDLFVALMDRQFLENFDETLVFEHDGKSYPARFKTYLNKTIRKYLRGHRDKQHRLASRELQLVDKPIGNHGGESWIDVYGDVPTVEGVDIEVINRLDYIATTSYLRTHLAAVPRRSDKDNCDLLAFFNVLEAQVAVEGNRNLTELAKSFNISPSGAHLWFWDYLIPAACEAMGRDIPARRHRRQAP